MEIKPAQCDEGKSSLDRNWFLEWPSQSLTWMPIWYVLLGLICKPKLLAPGWLHDQSFHEQSELECFLNLSIQHLIMFEGGHAWSVYLFGGLYLAKAQFAAHFLCAAWLYN